MLKTFLGLFAKPLGAAINNALGAGGAAVIVYGSKHGVDSSITAPIVGSIMTAISLAISAFASTQGVQIPVINQDTTNGVRVVNSDDAKAAGLPKVNAPLPAATTP